MEFKAFVLNMNFFLTRVYKLRQILSLMVDALVSGYGTVIGCPYRF